MTKDQNRKLSARNHSGNGAASGPPSGTSLEFWLGLQSGYDLEKAQEELAERIQREVQPRERTA